MVPSVGKANIGFFEVIRTTGHKYLYALVFAVIFGALVCAVVISSLSPTQLNEVTVDGRYDFEVKDSTEPPVELDVSHTFPISVSGGSFRVTEGPGHIRFSVKVIKRGGEPILNKTSSLDMPYSIKADNGQTSYVMSEDEDLELSPGKYSVSISSDHPVELHLTQKNRLELPLRISSIASFLGVVILVGVVISTFKKRDSIRASRMFAAMVSNTPTGPGYSFSRPFYNVPDYPPSTRATRYDFRTWVGVEHICAKCGNIIQNPVVQDVVTCEQCGEKEYVGKR